ncbi:short-chain dehydrogenase, partial [Mycobacterium sp. ITM-2017-0098]
MASLGAGVVVNGRDAAAVSEAEHRIADAVGFPGSPADPAVADALIDACVREFGRIDILVNCAGTAEPVGSSILNVTTEQFQN